MIVVEGPDGAGKTTLVKHLSSKFGMVIGERGVANRDKLYEVTRKDTYRALSMAVKSDDWPHVWDRLFVSEFVYHGIHPGRPCEFNPVETEFISRVLNAIGCPMIVCLPPYRAVRENVEAVHQMQGVKASISQIYIDYRDADLPWPDNTIWYDYTGQTEDFASLNEVEQEIRGYLVTRKARHSAWTA